MPFDYIAYGLQISSNAPIPGFLREGRKPEPDVVVEFINEKTAEPSPHWAAEEPWFRSGECGIDGRPHLRIWRRAGGYCFVYDDGTRIEVSGAASRIRAYSPAALSFADTACYVAGPALGFALRLRGVTAIHASAILCNAGAVLFTGDSGAGKSTIAAAMSLSGCPVITEDIAAVVESGGRFGVRKGYPRVNLWPDSVSALFGCPDALPEIASPWPKRYLAIDVDEFRAMEDPVPIRAIYFLTERTKTAGIEVAGMKPSDAALALIGNTYLNHLPGVEHQRRNFDALARLAGRVPVRLLPARGGDTAGLCAAVLEDLERSAVPAASVQRTGDGEVYGAVRVLVGVEPAPGLAKDAARQLIG